MERREGTIPASSAFREEGAMRIVLKAMFLAAFSCAAMLAVSFA